MSAPLTVKAYLSERGPDVPASMYVEWPTPARELELATAEAACILADTQHGIEGRLTSIRDTKLVVFSRTEREWHRRQGIWPAELTVADVVGPCLATFVADGGQEAGR